MFKLNLFQNRKKILIWTDGGPKHFKLSTNHYHGQSVCDGIAGVAKKKLNIWRRDNYKDLKSNIQICDVLNTIISTKAYTLPRIKTKITTPTLNGIKSFHKFTYSNFTIHAYTTTEEKLPSKSFSLTVDEFLHVFTEIFSD